MMNDGPSETAAITIIDDSVLEGDHQFTVNTAATDPPGVTLTFIQEVTIIDDGM